MFSRLPAFLVPVVSGAIGCLLSASAPGLAQTVTDPSADKKTARGNAGASANTANAAQTRDQPPVVVTWQRRERDDLRREDVAVELGQMGLPLKWQDWSLQQLTDWRDRLQAAQALRAQFGVDVDWRVQSLASLTDMRLRAAKASELASLYGVQVDWRRYSWVALEALRRQVSKLSGRVTTDDAVTADGLARPRSDGRSRRLGFRSKDPDAILEPTFAFDTPVVWSRPFGRRGKSDPDAILVPTFVTVPAPPVGPDDIIDPWRRHPSWFNP